MATAATATSKPRISPTTQILIGLVLGLIAGIVINNYNRDVVEIIRPFSAIFIRMIRMIIAPLLFGTLVAGIAGAGLSFLGRPKQPDYLQMLLAQGQGGGAPYQG